jgi:hypothetical protein
MMNGMNMWQLFKNLPRDLRWEVLSEFVGSHAVRKGKLIKKLVFGDRHQMIQDIPRVHKCYIHLYTYRYNAKTNVQLWGGSQLMFCDNPKTGEKGYMFRKRNIRRYSGEDRSYEEIYTPLNDSTTLSPFEKHFYPSFPDTDKKKKSRRPTPKPLCLRLPSGEEEDTLLLPPGSRWRPPLLISPPPKSPDGAPSPL